MTPEEALGLLQIGDEPLEPEQVRRAYLRRVKEVKPEVDPEGFARLRQAYELLRSQMPAIRQGPRPVIATEAAPEAAPVEPRPGAPAPVDAFAPYRERLRGQPPAERRAIAREALEALPDSIEARRVLLAHLSGPGADDEAYRLLTEGAARHPQVFTDDLLWFFPARASAATLQAAAQGAGAGRLLLIANAHAEQAHAEETLAAVQAALALVPDRSLPPQLLRLALRPAFSLHIRGLSRPADAIVALVKERAGDAVDATRADHTTAILLSIADELARLGPDLPLGLRQVAARAAKTGELEMVATEAGMLANALGESERAHWRATLRNQAPTIYGLFRLPTARLVRRAEVRRNAWWLWFLAPLVLSLIRIASQNSTPAISPVTTEPLVQQAALRATLESNLESECANAPPNIVCRDLPPIVHDLAEGHSDCANLRLRLQLLGNSSLDPLSGKLPPMLLEAERVLDARCRR